MNKFAERRTRVRRRAADVALGALVSEGIGVFGYGYATPVSYPYLYGQPESPRAMNGVKGDITERLSGQIVPEHLLSGTEGWVSAPARSGPQGLDGLYLRANSRGQIQTPLIVEDKFGSAQLGHTDDGRQMSEPWVRSRMEEPAQIYRRLAWEEGDTVVRRSYVPEDVEGVPVPLSGTESATIWIGGSGRRHVYVPEGSTIGRARVQTHRVADRLSVISEGTGDYRPILLRYGAVNGKHEITIERLSRDGTVATGPNGVRHQEVIRGSAEELPDSFSEKFRQDFQEALVENEDVPPEDAHRLADHALENPGLINRMGVERREGGYVAPLEGVVAGGGVLLAGGALSGLLSMARQLTREEDVDAVEIGRTAVVGAGSAGLAYQTGVGIHTGLLTTKPGRQIASLMPADQIAGQSVEQILGAGGGAVGSTAFIVGMHLTGDMTPQQSRRMVGRSLARILAFKGTTATTMGVVASTATASTGTPITALSGAAAHNATLAAMGGGATAGGGLGMAAGEIALGGMSFGVGTLFFVGTGYLFKRMDEAEQKATIEARIKLAKENVEEGNQPEWT